LSGVFRRGCVSRGVSPRVVPSLSLPGGPPVAISCVQSARNSCVQSARQQYRNSASDARAAFEDGGSAPSLSRSGAVPDLKGPHREPSQWPGYHSRDQQPGGKSGKGAKGAKGAGKKGSSKGVSKGKGSDGKVSPEAEVQRGRTRKVARPLSVTFRDFDEDDLAFDYELERHADYVSFYYPSANPGGAGKGADPACAAEKDADAAGSKRADGTIESDAQAPAGGSAQPEGKLCKAAPTHEGSTGEPATSRPAGPSESEKRRPRDHDGALTVAGEGSSETREVSTYNDALDQEEESPYAYKQARFFQTNTKFSVAPDRADCTQKYILKTKHPKLRNVSGFLDNRRLTPDASAGEQLFSTRDESLLNRLQTLEAGNTGRRVVDRRSIRGRKSGTEFNPDQPIRVRVLDVDRMQIAEVHRLFMYFQW